MQFFAATGEDAIVYCPGSDYAANMEKAEALAPAGPRGAATQALAEACAVATYKQLAWTVSWHIREETYQRALARIVDAQ